MDNNRVSHWVKELWQEATNKGITDVTREETVVMIMRALKQSK